MSFYIRDISGINRFNFKTNASLLISSEYKIEECDKFFNHIFLDNSNDFKCFYPSLKNKEHNNDLLILNNISFNSIKKFCTYQEYAEEAIEIIIPNSFSIDDINNLISQIIKYYKYKNISFGFLVSNSDYIKLNQEFIDNNGIFLSKFVPSTIKLDELIEEDFVECSKGDILCNCALPGASYDADLEESFKEKLIKYLNKSNKTNVQVYRKGGINRKLFSKILNNKNYNPAKETICCLIIGMELCLDDALDLLNAAGFTLSNSIMSDVIIKKHITNKNFDIYLLNKELDKYGLTMLGWKPRNEK